MGPWYAFRHGPSRCHELYICIQWESSIPILKKPSILPNHSHDQLNRHSCETAVQRHGSDCIHRRRHQSALTSESPEYHPRGRPGFSEEAYAIIPNIPLDHKNAWKPEALDWSLEKESEECWENLNFSEIFQRNTTHQECFSHNGSKDPKLP